MPTREVWVCQSEQASLELAPETGDGLWDQTISGCFFSIQLSQNYTYSTPFSDGLLKPIAFLFE